MLTALRKRLLMLLNAIDDPDSRDGATAKLACRQRIYRLTGPVSSRSKRFWQLSLVLIGLARVRPGVLSWVSDYSESANTTSASATGPRSWMIESEAATPRWAACSLTCSCEECVLTGRLRDNRLATVFPFCPTSENLR